MDLATGARRTLPPAARGDVEVAGDLTAWLEPATPDPPPPGQPAARGVVAVVIDGSGRELLRTHAPGDILADTGLALDSDGTIAVYGRLSESPRAQRIVATATPADPVLRRVPMPPRTAAVRGARLAAGWLAVLRAVEGRNQLTGGEVTVMSPRAAGARTALRGVDAFAASVDFDGRQIAAVARDCGRVALVRRALAADSGRALSPRKCRLRLARRPRLSHKGLNVTLSCSGFLSSCAPRNVIARLGGHEGPIAGRTTLDPDTRSFTIPLTTQARAQLRSRQARRVVISARVVDAWGDHASAPRRHTTTAVCQPRPARCR